MNPLSPCGSHRLDKKHLVPQSYQCTNHPILQSTNNRLGGNPLSTLPRGPPSENKLMAPRTPHRPLEASKTMVVAVCFARVRVWLLFLTIMLLLCAQRRAMSAPSGPLGAQTDPQSSPTRPKNRPRHEPLSLRHRLPEASNTMILAREFAHVRVWLLLLTFMLLQCAQQRAMTTPSGLLEAQTDFQSSPT
jgi:hypothetical protein